MDALTFFRSRYDGVHGRFTDDLLAGLTDAQLRGRPHPAVNTIGWLLWHMARAEDVGVNRLVGDRGQVFDDEGWGTRLGFARRDIGTGMTDADVDDLSRRVDLDGLRHYWAAVGRRTLVVVGGLGADDLDAPNPPEHVGRVARDEGALMDSAAWVADAWRGMNRGSVLGQLALAHSVGHIYEGRVVKGLWGIRGR
jgi:hypothetical protein